MSQQEVQLSAPAVSDAEVEEATRAAIGHREAYAARVSNSTRNPHSAGKGRTPEELAKLSPAERVLVQWRTAFGCPVSDEAKAQFSIECLGHTFSLADIRLWLEHHPQRNGKEQVTDNVHLEFFFDGMLSEIADDPTVFESAFKDMIERQLQEKRVVEFRNKLAARRRGTAGAAQAEDAESGGRASSSGDDDKEWRSYLHTPATPSNLFLRSTREAGCMIRFLVCQTSLSRSASEELGQIAFQEHFPIDGKAQELPVATKPLPTWVYCAGFIAVLLVLLTFFTFWTAFKKVMAS